MKIRYGYLCLLLMTACSDGNVSPDSSGVSDVGSLDRAQQGDDAPTPGQSSASPTSSDIAPGTNTGIVASPKKKSHFSLSPPRSNTLPTPTAEAKPGPGPELLPECPDKVPAGLVDIVAVPEEKSQSIYIVNITPRDEPYYYTVTTADNRIAKILDGSGRSFTKVLVPAGRTYSDSYQVQGVTMGQTTINHVSPYSSHSLPVGVWKVDGIVDYNDLGKGDVCYYADAPKTLLGDEALDAKVNCGEKVKSVAADGASRLLMRLKSGVEGAACYRIVSDQPASDHGQLDPSNSEDVRTVLDSSNIHWAFSTFIPPEEFELENKTEREVVIDFAFTPKNPGTGDFTRTNTLNVKKKIKIRRPPVLLVHGIWGSSSGWGDVFTTREPAGGWDIHAMDYPNTAAFGSVSGNVGYEISTMLKSARETDSMAVAKVDVIAHSMGNLVTRSYMDSDTFQWDDNFLEGNIRKLVALTSPHLGSKLANLLINLNEEFLLYPRVRAIEVFVGDIHGGGVCSIAENSPDLNALGDVDYVKGEGIVAGGGELNKLHGPMDWMETLFLWFEENTHLKPYYFQTSNDGIVAISSQMSGGAMPVSKVQAGDVHSSGVAKSGQAHVTGSFEAALYAYADLDGVFDVFRTGLAGINTNGSGVPIIGGRGTDAATYLNNCQPGGDMRPAAEAGSSTVTATTASKRLPTVSSAGVTVVSPMENSTFEPGSIVPIEVTVDPLLLATNILVVTAGANGVETLNLSGPPFTGSLTIPNNLSGTIPLMFLVQDAGEVIVGDASFNINIVSSEIPTELAVSPKRHYLNIPMTTPVLSRTISVRGTYADSSKRDLSNAITGTSYSSVDPAIATVTADGVVSAVAAGTTYIVINNNGVKAYSKVVVEDPVVNEVPADHTAQVSFTARGFRRDQETGRYVQQVVITNNGSLPLSLPLRLVITDLPAGVKLANAFGDTQVITPLGSAYIAVNSIERSFVSPGNTASATLEFLNFQGVPITYTPRLFTAIDP